MSIARGDNDDNAFIETCLGLKLLTPDDVKSLPPQDSVTVSIAQEAVKRGLLTPADVDIVESLLNPTDVVPGYEIEQLVGRGGMGVVYRARQRDLDRTVALKTILISNVSSPTVAARFEREAKALARLQHPNIIQALNFGRHEGRYYFAMEFVSGRTCEQAIQDGGLMPPANVWFIVRQVASGLLHASRQNLIHRDIKPANLILVAPPEGTPSPRGGKIVKIADFGLAMFADRSGEQMKLTTGDKIMGSPAYMSPEQFGGRDVDFRTDMYALGATAWHLLFGSPPFQGANLASLFRMKMEPLVVDRAELPAELPEDQWRLLMGLLDPDPDKRPPNYQVLIDAVDQLGVSSVPVTASHMEATSDQLPPISEQATAEVELVPEVMAAAGVANAQTESVEVPVATTRGSSSRWMWIGAAAVLAAGIGVITLSMTGSTSRGPRVYTRVVKTDALFDGVTLSGWDVGGSMVGAWNTVEAPDSSTAIVCTTQQGAISRRIPEVDHPRVSLFVWLQPEGGPVDIDFAIDADTSDVRGCVRLSGSQSQLGTKTDDFGALDVHESDDAPSTVHERYHVVYLERQPTDWYVFIEEQLLGTLPLSEVGEGSSMRLVVHGDRDDTSEPAAFFADMQLNDLRETQ